MLECLNRLFTSGLTSSFDMLCALKKKYVEKAKEVLGFSSKIDLEEGILKTAKHIKDKWKVTETVN